MDRAQERRQRFQVLLMEKGVGGAMIRNPYSFRYFTGLGWWQPALYIPAQGEPTVFAFEDEVEELREGTGIENILGYRSVERLMKDVTSTIRGSGAQSVGFDLDIDSSALLYQMFQSMHADRKVVDVHGLIMELRMVKDQEEVAQIREASRIAAKSLAKALEAVRPGASEAEVAAEAISSAMKQGAESVHIYVNSGRPRIHAHPRDKKIGPQDTVMVDVMPRYRGYYSDKAATLLLGPQGGERAKALAAYRKALEASAAQLRPGVTMEALEEAARKVIAAQGLEKYYVYGFGHGVGLRFEEDPITTIVVAHRKMRIREGMVINLGHPSLSGPAIGSVKVEETYLVTKSGSERLT